MDWIKNVGYAIKGALGGARTPVVTIPPILLLCEIMNRPGMSAIALTASIISRLEKEGIPTGKNPNGSDNLNNTFIRVFCEELINEIKNNAVVQSSVPTGAISAMGVGGNAGGPIVITAYNDKIATVQGLIR